MGPMRKVPKKAAGRAEGAKGGSGQAGKDPAKGPDGRRKVSPALVGVLGMVALVGVVSLVAGLGDGVQRAAPPAAPAPVTSPSVGGKLVAPPEGAGATPSPSGPPTFQLSEARDPFRPLVVPPPEGVTGTTSAATPTASPTEGSGAAEAPAPGGGQQVELVDVIVDDQGVTRAQVRVGGTVSTVAAGETFASTYTLVSIQGTCATLRNDDDDFTLCTGDQALK